ncbi:imm11 family protein [Psychromonas algicola]|uniref:imm11 family protein n=1 Tax=Psychromonas algicola TaxID=2555642 RepID=UPI001067CEFB|nr:DUF1629 domain-containing protein [Psychromonas sp. RZ5]TEW52544.1 hypothetical protein E2R67_02625 [Psychromonas sp. RZ5]
MKYWVFKISAPEGGAYLSRVPSKGPESYRYKKGESLIQEFKKHESLGMYFDPDYPDDTELFDFVDNINDLIIANQKIRDVFVALDFPNIEFLPIWLYDHQDQVASKEYAIVNVLGSVDCIDMEKSTIRMNSLIKDQVSRIKNLVLDYDKIPEDASIFRATTKLNEIFVRDDVKNEMESAGLEGCVFIEADGWNGLVF